MIIRSTQTRIGAIGTIAGATLSTQPLTSRSRRTGWRPRRDPHTALLPLPPRRSLHSAPAVNGGSPAWCQETPTVSVIIPTLNEEVSLPWVLQNLPPWVDEVVLVDGLSSDATEVLARRIRPDAVVVHQHRRGKGAAIRAGFAAATGDIIVMIDADGSTDPREMHRFIAALKDGSDFVKGSRYMQGGGSA